MVVFTLTRPSHSLSTTQHDLAVGQNARWCCDDVASTVGFGRRTGLIFPPVQLFVHCAQCRQ